jgi:hypothetical protein
MASFELLNPQNHRLLKLQSRAIAEPHFAQIVVGEFPFASSSCPILFAKEPDTGQFFAGVILSLKPGEPALKSIEERGGFVPLSLQCNGFYISGEHIAIDRDSPRFNETEGESLFNDSQQPNDCVRQIQVALGKLQHGMQATKQFIDALLSLKLIEPVDMTLGFDGGERLTLQGLYTISLDALRDIDDAAALRLFRSGHLEFAYAMVASLKQIGVLATLRNQRLKVRN